MKTGKAISKALYEGDDDKDKKKTTNRLKANRQRSTWNMLKRKYANDPEKWEKAKEKMKQEFEPNLLS